MLLFSPGDGTQRRAAHSKQIRECRDNADDWKHDAHAGQSQAGAAAHMSDEETVCDVVKHIYQLRDGHGDGHAQNTAGDAALAEILTAFQNAPPFRDGRSIQRELEYGKSRTPVGGTGQPAASRMDFSAASIVAVESSTFM